MSLLKGIWRPDESPRKGPNPHADSVLTERLAELLGRELEELQDTAQSATQNSARIPAVAGGEERAAATSDGHPEFGVEASEERHPGWAEHRKTPKRTGPSGGSTSIARATETALGQLRSAQQEIEASIRTRAQEFEQALEAAIHGVERGGAAPAKTAEDAAEQFRTEARAWFDEARRELREQLEMSRAAIEVQLRAHHADLLQAAQQRIESLTQVAVQTDAQSSRQAVQEQVERWLKEQGQISRNQTEAGAQTLAKATAEAMDRLRTMEERIEASFRTQVEEYRRTVQAATQALEQKGISQAQFQNAAEELQKVTSDILERSGKRIEEQAERALDRIGEKLETAQQSLAAAARAAIEGALEERQQKATETWQRSAKTAVEALTEAGERNRAELEAARKAAAKEFQDAAQEQARRLSAQLSTEMESGGARQQLSRWLEEQTAAARRQASEAARQIEQSAGQGAARLEAIAKESEAGLGKRLEEQQQHWLESALEATRKSGFERKVVEGALAELEKSTQQFLDQATRRLDDQAASSHERMAKEMEAASHKLLEGVEASLEGISWQHRGRLAQWWEERAQAARREAEMASQTIAQNAQQATSQLRAAQGEIESELKSRARDHQMRLLDSAMEEMRRGGAIERAVGEATLALRQSADEVLDRATGQLREQAEATRKGLENQSLAARREAGEEMARKVEQARASVEGASKALTEDYRRQLSVWWEERSQTSRRETEEAAQGISRSARQASEQLQAIQRQIATELQSGMEDYRKGLREAAAEELRRQGFQKDILDSVASELTNSAQELTAKSRQQLERHIETTLNSLEQKAQGSRQAFLDESQKRLGELVRTSMDVATAEFQKLLGTHAQELEREQEEWLQRKREAVWLEINKHAAEAGTRSSPGHETSKDSAAKKGSASVWGKLITVMLVIALAVGLTITFVKLAPRPTFAMELKNDPPAGFVYENPAWSPQLRAHQLQLAQAYWMIAINDLQHRFPYGKPLPAAAPPDFQVNQNGLRDDLATRARYWQEIKQIWTSPSDWQMIPVSGNTLQNIFAWAEHGFTTAGAAETSSSANP